MRELIKECTHKAVELASLTEGAATWREWQSGDVGEPSIPTKEEKYLWWILTELDKEDAKKEKKQKLKEPSWAKLWSALAWLRLS
jgi:hypothetical protein